MTSRSAPEGGIFSPPTSTANLICGPFSRSHSPTTSLNVKPAHYRSLPSEASFISDAEETAGTPAMDLSGEMEGIEYESWQAGGRSLTESAILAAQQELLGSQREEDDEFDFDFSMDNLKSDRSEETAVADDFRDRFVLVKRRSSLAEDGAMTPVIERDEEEIDGMIEGLHVTVTDDDEEASSVKADSKSEDGVKVEDEEVETEYEDD